MSDKSEYSTTDIVSFKLIQRPAILRSLPSTQITACSVHACKTSTTHKEYYLTPTQSVSKTSLHQNRANTHSKSSPEVSRTQHKLLLQRQSFLADDKNHLDHPDNMRRLTKELDRMNREYKYVKQYHDPFLLSLKRVKALQEKEYAIPLQLQRRASSHTIQEYIKQINEGRRHSFSSIVTTSTPTSPPGFLGRMFGVKAQHSPLTSF